jgi:hypothetical protein
LKQNLKLLIVILGFSYNCSLVASELVFYKAPAFFGEPRLTKNYLGSFEWTAGGGHATEGFNGSGAKTSVLNIYGPENFRNLAQNVPQSILNLNPGSVIDDLWETSLPGFGQIEFDGRFKITEWIWNFQQNFKHGLFMELNIPLLQACVKDFKYIDLSPQSLAGTTNYAQWQAFVANLIPNLALYGINLYNYKQTAFGDLRFSLGWSQTKLTNNMYADFWDTAIKVGIIIPTAPYASPLCPLVVPLGYNKNVAFPLSFDLSVGFFEWITIGAHIEGVLFAEKYQNIGLKTASEQRGLFTLTPGNAWIEKGNIWQFGTFFKTDHMPWGLSTVIAYSYSLEQRTFVSLPTNSNFDRAIINSDQRLFGWNMQTVNVSVEYDFAVEQDKQNLPRLRLNFDIPVAGKYVYKNKIFSGTIGLDFVW